MKAEMSMDILGPLTEIKESENGRTIYTPSSSEIVKVAKVGMGLREDIPMRFKCVLIGPAPPQDKTVVYQTQKLRGPHSRRHGSTRVLACLTSCDWGDNSVHWG